MLMDVFLRRGKAAKGMAEAAFQIRMLETEAIGLQLLWKHGLSLQQQRLAHASKQDFHHKAGKGCKSGPSQHPPKYASKRALSDGVRGRQIHRSRRVRRHHEVMNGMDMVIK